MSGNGPKLSAWERTLLEFMLTDAKKARAKGKPERFVVVLSPKAARVIDKAAHIYGLETENPLVHKIQVCVDPDMTIEYAIQDLDEIALKIENEKCPRTP